MTVMAFAGAAVRKLEIFDSAEIRKCTTCGLEKTKVDFPYRSIKLKSECRVCTFMTTNKLAHAKCTECGHEKPIVAFLPVQPKSGRKCRVCMNTVKCVAELV
jgi:hypothetical protein